MTNKMIEDNTPQPASQTGPAERFLRRRSSGEVALLAILIGTILFVSGLTVGGALRGLGF